MTSLRESPMKKDGPTVYDEKTRHMAEQMMLAEERHIAQRIEDECDCKDGMFPQRGLSSRRGFLFAAGSAAGALGAMRLAHAEAALVSSGAVFFVVSVVLFLVLGCLV